MTPSAFQSQYQNLSPVQSKTLLGFLQPNPVLAFQPCIEVTFLIKETDARDKNVQNFY